MLRESDQPKVAPRNTSEAMLSAIWCDLLRLETVSVHDDFFELGGHSLLAFRVINRVKSQTDVELSVLYLFDHPTIAELAAFLEEQA